MSSLSSRYLLASSDRIAMFMLLLVHQYTQCAPLWFTTLFYIAFNIYL